MDQTSKGTEKEKRSSIAELDRLITESDVYRKYSLGDSLAVYKDYFLKRMTEASAEKIIQLDGLEEAYTEEGSEEVHKKEPAKIGEILCDILIETAMNSSGVVTQQKINQTVRRHIESQKQEKHTYLVSVYRELSRCLPASYRTGNRAGRITEAPDKLYLPVADGYRNALSFYDDHDDNPHMEMTELSENLEFEDGVLMIQGVPASRMLLRDYRTNAGVENIDLMLLRSVYSFMLEDAQEKLESGEKLSDSITIYAPSLIRYMGKSKLGGADIDKLVKDINAYQVVYGMIRPDGDPENETLYQVLNIASYNRATNTLTISSPYLTSIIEALYRSYQSRQKRLKRPAASLDIDEVFQSMSLVKPELGKERAKMAVEVVVAIVVKIAGAKEGRKVKMTAREIINRIPQLKQKVSRTVDPETGEAVGAKVRNRVLSRTFKKAFELLRTDTYLPSAYPQMALPDPSDPKMIPTIATLNLTYTFDKGIAAGEGK